MKFYKKGNKGYLIEKQEEESLDIFFDRANFIVCQNGDYNHIITYSYIYINTKYRGTKYNNEVMEKLDQMIKNCKNISL